jgi:hypothetical protein
MTQKKLSENRRDFLTKVIPLAALACFGCKQSTVKNLTTETKNKVSDNLGMTAEETYSFFYGLFIPVLQKLSNEMGIEKFNALLTKLSTDNTAQMIASMTKDLPEKDIKAFSTFMQNLVVTPPYNSALTYEIVEQTDKVVEFKYTECLPAKLLRAMNAIDIGLALECSGAEAAAKAFNPKISYSNPKNIMKGDSYCIERFTMIT